MPETKDSSQTKPQVTLVCTGKTYTESGGVGLVFAEVNSDGSFGEIRRIYPQKDIKDVKVGSVYEVDVAEDNRYTIYPGTIRWVRVWADETEAASWQALADAFDTEELAKQHERKETSRKLPLELLKPLREQYWATNSASRLAIEVRVLAYLRNRIS